MTTDTPDLSDFDGRIVFLGAGVMGGAVLSGLLEAGLPPEHVTVTDPSEEARARWSERGVEATADNETAVEGADIVVVALKPYLVAEVLDEVAGSLGRDTVVVSLAAGVTLATLQEHAGAQLPVVRVMPNTPALVGEGMFVVSPGAHCTDEQVATVDRLLQACGHTEVVAESMQDAATGLSGSGPAYVFYVADALIEAGVLEGLSRPVATRLAEQTLLGAATMLRDGDTPAAILREQVTSPGGSTAAALRALDRGAVRYHLIEAVGAATRRSAELGD
ncbi:pyrroline-5-carboxylate reductase [Mobilicoccus massiliensis]|uniref:pyrroline-5-carboxylate reductase n=1 Tax=Mobilicoccus massiliensis TaxID=1522310 RepID=UPI000693D7B8|nr:pyrroline-5-carboxylate reductase [Mobilicoccus massiliensis]